MRSVTAIGVYGTAVQPISRETAVNVTKCNQAQSLLKTTLSKAFMPKWGYV